MYKDKKEHRKYNRERYNKLKQDPDFKEKENQKSKERYNKNLEKSREYSRKQYAKHKEKRREQCKVYAQKNKDKIRLRRKKYAESNKEILKSKSILKRFGITLEQYNEILLSQSGVCKICKTEKTELNRKLCIDHCHTTGKIRGLLCDRCNRGLGVFKDDIELLENVIEYLKESNGNT